MVRYLVLTCVFKIQRKFQKAKRNLLESYLFIKCTWPKTRKPNVFQTPFRDQSVMTVMYLFNHVWQTVCLYLSMCVRLKWVGSDKLLESVFCLMDIRVTDNFRQYLWTVICVLLLLPFIWNLWGNYNYGHSKKTKIVYLSDENC